MFGTASGSGSGSGPPNPNNNNNNNNKRPPRSSMRGYAYVPETQSLAEQAAEEDAAFNYTGERPRGQRRRGVVRPPLGGGDGAGDGDGDEEMGGMGMGGMGDDAGRGEMGSGVRGRGERTFGTGRYTGVTSVTSADVPAQFAHLATTPPPPPSVYPIAPGRMALPTANFPAPNVPNAPMPVPLNGAGRPDRQLLNARPDVWWNQPGQERTEPASDACFECAAAHAVCDLGLTGYPCSRCVQRGIGEVCRNGVPSLAWEVREIGRAFLREGAGVAAVVMGGPAPPRPGLSSRGRRIARPETYNEDENEAEDLARIASAARFARRQRDGPQARERSASPRREDDDDDDDDDDDEEEEYEEKEKKPSRRRQKRNQNAAQPTNGNRKPKNPRTDAQYLKMYKRPRKCKRCTERFVVCSPINERPCAHCRRRGERCEDVNGNLYVAQGPVAGYPDDDDGGDGGDDGGDDGPGYMGGGDDNNDGPGPSGHRDAYGVPIAPPNPYADAGGPNSAPNPYANVAGISNLPNVHPNPYADVDDPAVAARLAQGLEHIWERDYVNGQFNPFTYVPGYMRIFGFGIPSVNRIMPLTAPEPVQLFLDARDRRVNLAIQANERAMSERAGHSFAENSNPSQRSVFDRQSAAANWRGSMNVRLTEPLVARPVPIPYDVNRAIDPIVEVTTFGDNMVDLMTSIPGTLPIPPAGEQIPWVATWNWSNTRHSQAHGPLGWPYPSIEPLGVNHSLTTDGYADPVNCCEDATHFDENARQFMGNVACENNPAMLCEAVPRYATEHPRNPWHTCQPCLVNQNSFWKAQQFETLQKQKLFTCIPCGDQVRREGRSWPQICICSATKLYRDVCHGHRENLERQVVEPIALAEDWLLRQGVLGIENDKCINCGVAVANPASEVWSCKICREWVQDSHRVDIDRNRNLPRPRRMDQV